MQKAGEHDRSLALKFDARIKSLANTMKNYRGRLKGLQRLPLVERKQEEERALQAFILAEPDRKARYGTLLDDLAALYEEMRSAAPYEFAMDNLRSSSTRLASALLVVEGSRELQKPDIQRETLFMARNLDRTRQSIGTSFRNYHEPVDRRMLEEILERVSCLPTTLRVEALEDIVGGKDPAASIRAFLDQAYAMTMLRTADTVFALMSLMPDRVSRIDDPFLQLAGKLEPAYRRLREERQAREGRLTRLSADLVDVKQEFTPATFIPDANSTLRFTSGKVRGYSPADATYYRPFTTLAGVLEKTTGKDPFVTPSVVRDLHRARKFGRYVHPGLGTVPVALLYNLDTTGGNSGSPLLNGKGEVVGVNFDRTFEATINDYAWSEEYSRSIAVDIRYVLWVTEAVGGASFLLREMGVDPSITN
jgi:hypothetical protein